MTGIVPPFVVENATSYANDSEELLSPFLVGNGTWSFFKGRRTVLAEFAEAEGRWITILEYYKFDWNLIIL
jgi:hypothetical protein